MSRSGKMRARDVHLSCVVGIIHIDMQAIFVIDFTLVL